jgi:hypothetical protein
VAFNAPRLHPSFTSHLLLAFTEHVLIERFPIRMAFPHMLGQSYKLGRHSDVFLLTSDIANGAPLNISKFVWTHIDHRPWGGHLPLQCSMCGWVNAWRSVGKGKTIYVECKNNQCKNSYTFSQPNNAKVLGPGKMPGCCWMEVPVETSVA